MLETSPSSSPICPPPPHFWISPCLFIHTIEAELHACSENLSDPTSLLSRHSKSAFNPKPVSQQKCSVEATTQHFISWESLQAQTAGSQCRSTRLPSWDPAAQPPEPGKKPECVMFGRRETNVSLTIECQQVQINVACWPGMLGT